MEVVTLLLSLILGSVGGIVVAGPIARRGAAAQKRYEAELRLAGIAQGYRNQLAHQHDQVLESNLTQLPQGYASWQGQERLAEAVLVDLPYFPRRIQFKARRLIGDLVGLSTLRFVESQLHVPEDQRTVESSKDKLARALHEQGTELSEPGHLDRLLRIPIWDTSHHEIYLDADQALRQLIAIVNGDRGFERWLRRLLVRVVNLGHLETRDR